VSQAALLGALQIIAPGSLDLLVSPALAAGLVAGTPEVIFERSGAIFSGPEILGCGFGSLHVAGALRRADVEVLLAPWPKFSVGKLGLRFVKQLAHLKPMRRCRFFAEAKLFPDEPDQLGDWS
jgi:hypothetical protein